MFVIRLCIVCVWCCLKWISYECVLLCEWCWESRVYFIKTYKLKGCRSVKEELLLDMTGWWGCCGYPKCRVVCAPGNLYWTDKAQHLIQVARLNGSRRYVIIHDSLTAPTQIAVDPVTGWVRLHSCHARLHTRMHECTFVHKHVYSLYTHKHIYTVMHADPHVCTHGCTHHTHMRACTGTYVHTYACDTCISSPILIQFSWTWTWPI